jgi:glycerol kinase
VRGRAYSEFTQHYPKPGWVEHDAVEIWTVSLKVMRAALRAAKLKATDLAAIGITNQRETTVLWDRRTGTPVHRAIVWQDRRTADMCTRLKADGAEAMVRSKTGLVVDAYFSGTKLRWLFDHVRGLRGRDLAFGTIDSWLIWQLTAAVCTSPITRTRRARCSTTSTAANGIRAARSARRSRQRVAPAGHVERRRRDHRSEGVRRGDPDRGHRGDQQAALFGQACFRPAW